MKNLNDFTAQELSEREMTKINGGGFWSDFLRKVHKGIEGIYGIPGSR